MQYHCRISIITHAFIVAFNSDVTNIPVNQQNVIQHPYWGKIFPIRDDYALQIYGIVVGIDICIFSLKIANTKLYFTKVKRNLINQHTVNKLLTQKCISRKPRFKSISKVRVCHCCTSLVQCVVRKVNQSMTWLVGVNQLDKIRHLINILGD